MNHCAGCGRDFGGVFAYDRHVDRRRNRCRPDRELIARGLVERDGVWHQLAPHERPLRLDLRPLPRRIDVRTLRNRARERRALRAAQRAERGRTATPTSFQAGFPGLMVVAASGWDTVDAAFAVPILICGYGALRMVAVIAREYGTERMTAAWLARRHQRAALTFDWREEAQ